MARFTLPRDLYHGRGSLEALKSLSGKKAIICVGGGSMKRGGFLQRAEDYLKEAGMEVIVFEGIEPDPSVETVMKGAAIMQDFQPDWIVAMGGGSPIDAAKAMWIKYEYPDTTFEDMCKVFGLPKLRTKAHFCAIPSTSGTATEVTAFSVITNYQEGIKYPLADFEITPDVAIVDPELAETMPPKLAAHTGMDAMTHAIEAYVSTANCDYTDPLALSAIQMVRDNLVKSFGGDTGAKEKMHNAQCLAGMAFSNALLGIVHSMAHKTGAAFDGGHIIHGAANAMYLPKVIKYNSKDPVAAERYAYIADFLGLDGSTTEEKVDSLIAMLRKMNDDLNIPQCIKNYGEGGLPAETGIVPEDEFLAKLPKIAANAIIDACTGSNPRQPSQEEMEKLLKCCYYDTEVDF
ncbi:MAG: iron-containing alcohol dehydrogenase [Butyrivibrio sp.]|nr:iron-containing alcohol dehydrogenase [Butyrivibrio sp.]